MRLVFYRTIVLPDIFQSHTPNITNKKKYLASNECPC